MKGESVGDASTCSRPLRREEVMPDTWGEGPQPTRSVRAVGRRGQSSEQPEAGEMHTGEKCCSGRMDVCGKLCRLQQGCLNREPHVARLQDTTSFL